MKPDIHPKYYPNARVVCACGHTWTTGATLPEIRVDVCSNCHPFFTGEQRIVDTAGRVDRFRMRLLQKREKKVEKPRKEKFLIVGPDDEVKPEPAKAQPVAVAAPAASAPVAELAPAAPVAAEAHEEGDSVQVRTVVEGSDEVLSDDDARSRRTPTRKAKPPRAEGDNARKPKQRKPESAEKEPAPEAAQEPAEGSGS